MLKKGRKYKTIGGKKILIKNLSKQELTRYMRGPVFNPRSQKQLRKEGKIF